MIVHRFGQASILFAAGRHQSLARNMPSALVARVRGKDGIWAIDSLRAGHFLSVRGLICSDRGLRGGYPRVGGSFSAVVLSTLAGGSLRAHLHLGNGTKPTAGGWKSAAGSLPSASPKFREHWNRQCFSASRAVGTAFAIGNVNGHGGITQHTKSAREPPGRSRC